MTKLRTTNMKPRILIPLLTLACLLATPAIAQVNYVVNGGTAYVTASPTASGNIVIASTYNGVPVTWLRQEAFDGCTNLTSVTIPNSVTRIDTETFNHCTSLTNITVAMDDSPFTTSNGVMFHKT